VNEEDSNPERNARYASVSTSVRHLQRPVSHPDSERCLGVSTARTQPNFLRLNGCFRWPTNLSQES